MPTHAMRPMPCRTGPVRAGVELTVNMKLAGV
jgi:hypothetical protein